MLPGVLLDILRSGRHERLPHQELLKLQEKRLAAMVRHAYDNTRFWHEWMDTAGVRPTEIRRLEDLSKLPISSKQDLIGRPLEDRLAEDPEECVKMSTSGTTGGPMTVYWSRTFSNYVALLRHYRFSRLAEVSSFSRFLRIGFALRKPGESVGLQKTDRSRRRKSLGTVSRFLGPIIDRYDKSVFLSHNIDEIIGEIIDFRPDVIRGNPSYLRLLAEFMAEHHIDKLRPKALCSDSEILDEANRKYLEGAFGCSTFDAYGTWETGRMALECTFKTGLHIYADMIIMEILKDGEQVSPGEPGEIVVTGLLNGAMPLLRYRTRDIGIMTQETCPCGRTLPLLKSVEGREVDHIPLPGGAKVSPRLLVNLIHSVRDLPRCQLVQEELDRFELKVFPLGRDVEGKRIDELVSLLQVVLGNQVSITPSLEKSDRIRAKFRPVISLTGKRTDATPAGAL